MNPLDFDRAAKDAGGSPHERSAVATVKLLDKHITCATSECKIPSKTKVLPRSPLQSQSSPLISFMRKPIKNQLGRSFSILCATGAISCCVGLPLDAQVAKQEMSVSVETIAADYAALVQEISYRGLPEILHNSQSTVAKEGVALLVARTQLRDVPEELLLKLSEQVAANNRNPNLKLVTLSDLNANSSEAKGGGADKGTLLDFSNNQSVLNSAIAQGIAMVLFVDLTHCNSKAATVTDGLNLVNARASLTLLNAADGVRIKGVDRDVKARGFDSRDLLDKAFDLLSKDLSQEASRWKLPSLQIKLIQLEVHAKIEGIQFPMMDVDKTGQIQVNEVPVFAEGASVEIDGVLKGQAPCRIDVTPGTHKLKVYRDGTKPFFATIQVSASNRYDALLVPTDESRLKFDAQLAKFERAKTMALARNVQMEREGVRTDGIRIANENSRQQGQAVADVIQSRADVARTDAKSRSVIASGEGAVLQGKAAVLNERAKGELRKANADSELQYAKADAVRNDAQSRADVARTDANSRSVIASGDGAVLQGKAAVLNESAKGEVGRVNANSELQSSRAEAVRKEADGKLAVQQATAANITTVARYQNEALKEQISAMKSFAESLGSLGFRVISAQGR